MSAHRGENLHDADSQRITGGDECRVFDDVVQRYDPEHDVADTEDVRAVREFNQRVASDPRLTSIMIPAYDGLVVALADGLR